VEGTHCGSSATAREDLERGKDRAKTTVIIREFFGETREGWMKTQLGWNVADAVEIYTAVNQLQSTDPIGISDMKLLGEKVTPDALNALRPNLAHACGVVNAGYVSPVGAKSNLT
jgi:hypothetical protein